MQGKGDSVKALVWVHKVGAGATENFVLECGFLGVFYSWVQQGREKALLWGLQVQVCPEVVI